MLLFLYGPFGSGFRGRDVEGSFEYCGIEGNQNEEVKRPIVLEEVFLLSSFSPSLSLILFLTVCMF